MAVTTRAAEAAERLPDPSPRADLRRGHAVVLAGALVLASTYAAFAAGATRLPQESRLELLVLVVALGAVVSWAAGGIAWRTSRPAALGLGLLFALAAWSAISLLWSITPDRTWLEANRTLAYALAVALALAVGASDPRAIERTATLLLVGTALVALYALATTTLPGVVPQLLDVGRSGAPGRLREPLGYANALALVCATAAPLAVHLAGDPSRRRRWRGLALAAGLLLVVVLGLTSSLGGLVALGVAAVVLLALGGARARSLAVLAGLGLASVPVLVVAFSLPGTADDGVANAISAGDGRTLLLTFGACLAVLLVVASALWRPRRRAWTAARTRLLHRAAATVAVLGVLLAVAGVAASDRGLSGTVADRVDAMTAPSRDDASDPARAGTATPDNRRAWWREAAGAWSDRPVAGWGAGSFRATHLRYRRDELSVTQAHSVAFQLLAETGLVGLALLAGGLGALAAAAVSRLRALPRGGERDLAAAALAGVAGWLVHGLFDWSWSIPGATLPALILLGVVAGAVPGRARSSTPGVRPIVVAAAALVLGLAAVSAVLPAWADGRASEAQLAVRAGSGEALLADAAAEAQFAARLDPLALRPVFASAAIARRRGRLLESRGFLLRAVERQPESAEAWLALADAASALADREGYERAALRALELDPRSRRARRVARAAVAFRTPPGASATAVGTPLTPAPVQAPPVAPAPPPTGATGPAGG